MPARKERWSSFSDASSDSGYSDRSEHSDHSHHTAPTVYSHDSRPALKSHKTDDPYSRRPWDEASDDGGDPRLSTETYASTIASIDDLDDDQPLYEVPDEEPACLGSTAIPSTPSDFAEYFPSTRRLHIQHDDSTLDGNMNLRVDTDMTGADGRKVDLTLFHLRMHNLKNRDFSLRRYCRDSGREVCHSSRKYSKPASMGRPGLQRSMSNALSSFRAKSDPKQSVPGIKRHDSYDSMTADDVDGDEGGSSANGRSSVPLPTNTTKLEFSNYAHLEVKRRGTKASKRYEFEYWGTSYVWRRVARRTGNFKEISYHLINTETSHPVAHIVPAALTIAEANEERTKGGWIPPCSLWISDPHVLNGQTDIAEYVFQHR